MLSGRAVGAVAVAAFLGLLDSGCSSPAPSKPAAHAVSAATNTTPSPSTTLDAQGQAALVSYRAMWADLAAVADSGNYQQARLGDHMTGKLFVDSSQNLFLSEQRGMVGRGEPVLLRPQVKSEDLTADPPVITIADCLDERGFLLYYAATGKPVDNDPGGLQAATTQMTLVNGVWKGSSEYLGAEGSCSG